MDAAMFACSSLKLVVLRSVSFMLSCSTTFLEASPMKLEDLPIVHGNSLFSVMVQETVWTAQLIRFLSNSHSCLFCACWECALSRRVFVKFLFNWAKQWAVDIVHGIVSFCARVCDTYDVVSSSQLSTLIVLSCHYVHMLSHLKLVTEILQSCTSGTSLNLNSAGFEKIMIWI